MATIIVAAAVLTAFILAVKRMWNNKKQGKSISCGGDCRNCKKCSPD